ncbi:MAG: YbhB/YbcL family Raf kinase inhibitor-like protein, partial [Candidatus Eremiobacteraeota bacterium]|nr:YbhB/YbcL family Raf kinase inhibitor-like protein [Candidatus Eremiobacteraeota bacterium]
MVSMLLLSTILQVAQAASPLPTIPPNILKMAPKAATLRITPEYTPGKPIPKKFAMKECGGEDRSPRVSWSGVPKGTKSFILTLTDSTMDSAAHWIVADIPGTTRGLPPNAQSAHNPAYGRVVRSSFGGARYYGPCPPQGSQHMYVLTLYALDVPHLPVETPPDV